MNKQNMMTVYGFLAGLAFMPLCTALIVHRDQGDMPTAGVFSNRVRHDLFQPHDSPLPWVANAPPKVGMVMPDGSLYAGVSPQTRAPIYTTPAGAGQVWDYNQARAYCAKMSAYGDGEWRLPTKRELEWLYRYRVDLGGFETSGEDSRSWYWSSSAYYFTAWKIRFSTGSEFNDGKKFPADVRCIKDDSSEYDTEQAAASSAATYEPAAGRQPAEVPSEQQAPAQPMPEPQSAPEAYRQAVQGSN